MKHFFHFISLLTALFLLSSPALYSQRTDANIVGHVLCCGEHIPGITVHLKGTGRGTTTDKTGHYYLRNLPEGEYILRAQGMGYSTKEQRVELKSGATLEIGFAE